MSGIDGTSRAEEIDVAGFVALTRNFAALSERN